MSPEEKARIEQVLNLAACAMRAACKELAFTEMALEVRPDGRCAFRVCGVGLQELAARQAPSRGLVWLADLHVGGAHELPGTVFLDAFGGK